MIWIVSYILVRQDFVEVVVVLIISVHCHRLFSIALRKVCPHFSSFVMLLRPLTQFGVMGCFIGCGTQVFVVGCGVLLGTYIMIHRAEFQWMVLIHSISHSAGSCPRRPFVTYSLCHFWEELLEELHSGRTMQDSLHVCLFALVYADDLVEIATSPTALQDHYTLLSV